ncbi:MAG: hypothetical protein MJ252_28120 [archaeon]|nr:hypothetical protein [archaeon]
MNAQQNSPNNDSSPGQNSNSSLGVSSINTSPQALGNMIGNFTPNAFVPPSNFNPMMGQNMTGFPMQMNGPYLMPMYPMNYQMGFFQGNPNLNQNLNGMNGLRNAQNASPSPQSNSPFGQFGFQNNSNQGQNAFGNQNPQNTNERQNSVPIAQFEDKTNPTLTVPSNDSFADMFSSLNLNQSSENTCKDFLNGFCIGCNKVHGYGGYIVNLSEQSVHNGVITNIVKTSETSFITTDENTLKEYKIEDRIKCVSTKSISDFGIIDKVYFLYGALFISKNYKLDGVVTKSSVVIFEGNRKSVITLNSHSVHGIAYLKHLNRLIVFTSGFIEIYGRNPGGEFQLEQNLNLGNEVNCSVEVEGIIFCGLNNGCLSVLRYGIDNGTTYFNEIDNKLIHEKPFTTLNYVSKNTPLNVGSVFISTSEDLKIKVLKWLNRSNGNPNERRTVDLCAVISMDCGSPIVNFFSLNDHRGNERYAFICQEGNIIITTTSLQTLFEINTRGWQLPNGLMRSGIALRNPMKQVDTGDQIIISYGNKLECDLWKNYHQQNSFQNFNFI